MEKILQPVRIGFFALVIILLLAVVLSTRIKVGPDKKVHYHAGFIVFQNDEKLDFSDSKYMYIKPCTVNGKDDEGTANNQLEKAHLHDNVGDIVHIERSGAIWGDLFSNIHFPIDYQKTQGYINGRMISDYQTRAIGPDDSLVIFIGINNFDKGLREAPTKDYIEKMAKKSTTCGD